MKPLLKTAALAVLLSTTSVLAEIKGEALDYSSNGVTLKGYIAYDDAITDKRPGVLVVHEWWGHNEYARKRARMLAEMGYTALAVDMYGEGKVAEHPKDAKAFMMKVLNNMDSAKARFLAAKDTLEKHASVDAEKIAAIGYCFGGGVVLGMARSGMDLDGVASFHGSLGTKTPAKKGAVNTKIRVFTGQLDPMIPAEQVKLFEEEMKAADVDYSVVVYPNAKHSFTNPDADKFGEQFSMPLAYDAEADKDSWSQLKTFLADIFK